MPRRRVPSPPWSDVCGLLSMKLNDAAEVLGISATHLKFICRRNGLPRWPGKAVRMLGWIRSLNAKLTKLTLKAASQGPLPVRGAANRRHRRPAWTKIKQQMKEVWDKLIQVRNTPEKPEVGADGTVNLLDKVGVSRGSGANRY
ncbi:hypothetical protein QOZ80_8BG0650710 [Eleusine coracana subsp. coracana]|nr:hypothetical protein QOZ80_8BG0650710 [Eleusine coracana subsp. coracana]